MKVLLVEDEHRIAQAIKEGLVEQGYTVDVEHNGKDGYSKASAAPDEYDIIVLDVMMPVMNGYEMSIQLRKDGNHTPILMLTAKDQLFDVITGFDTGADDYLGKPFSFDV